jgi:hypothetical protein
MESGIVISDHTKTSIFKKTFNLRQLKTIHEVNGSFYDVITLQQMFIDENGVEIWVDVPTVTKE